MGLAEYRKKRRFQKTPEPDGAATKKAASRKAENLKFVVQKHAASRLHYDFRLEFAGVLKSWAVPKGPSLDPHDKRLAVQVEDHPLAYATFEGTIPAGEYGAGEVIVWDRGKWLPEGDVERGLRAGQLKFELEGEKLHGGWALVRMQDRSSSKSNWLLIKHRDETSRPAAEYDITSERPESVKSGRQLGKKSAAKKKSQRAAAGRKKAARKKTSSKRAASKFAGDEVEGAVRAKIPDFIQPQLATLRSQAPQGEQWLHEIKFDGYRILCRVQKGKARLITRNEQDWTHRYRAVADEAAELPVREAILDGEMVALFPSGISSFQALQNSGRSSSGNGTPVRLAYYAFDLLYLDGYDLRRLSLAQRKQLLQEVLSRESGNYLHVSDHFDNDGPAFFQQCCQMGLEGIISKRRDQPYISGRSGDWVKAKCIAREEVVVGGFTLSPVQQRGIGALLVGYFQGGDLIYSGRVGTGFDTRTLLDLGQRLEAISSSDCPFLAVPSKERGKSVRWVQPKLVAQVEFTGWTDDAILRHPSFQGLREDKPARSVSRPQSLKLAGPIESGASMKKKSSPKKEKRKSSQAKAVIPANLSVSLTHPERVLYPDIGLTKLGLATYYAQVATWMLPYIKGRPLSLVRCPKGQTEKCFFQKHAVASTPAALRRVDIAEKGETVQYVTVEDIEGLLSLVQMSVLEIHPWGSRRDRLEHPDQLIFDLDPDDSVAWPKVIAAAQAVRDLLADYKLTSFVKTTGGKGLHVVVPLAPRRIEWPTAKDFCRHVAEQLVAADPRQYIAKMSKAARKGKIFVDYLRNDRGATAIAPFSTRARTGAPVSTPLAWEELSPSLRSDHFHIGNLLGRLESLTDDPWDDFFDVKQTLPRKW